VQLHLLDVNNIVLGGCSLENTMWQLSEDGLTNQSVIIIGVEVYTMPKMVRITNSNGTKSKFMPIYLYNERRRVEGPGVELVFPPGALTITEVFWKEDDGGKHGTWKYEEDSLKNWGL
jgi:hypothetical protein